MTRKRIPKERTRGKGIGGDRFVRSLFAPEEKKETSGGLRCHTKTMMSTEACEAQTLTPIMLIGEAILEQYYNTKKK